MILIPFKDIPEFKVLPSPLESSPNCPPTSPPPPQLVEKLSSARPAPDARKVGDHSSRQHPRCRQSLFPGCALGCDSCFLKFTYLGCAGSLHLGSVGLWISFAEPVNCLEFFMQTVSCLRTCIFLGDSFFHFLSHSKNVKNG